MLSLHEVLNNGRLIQYVDALRESGVKEPGIRKAVEQTIRLTKATLTNSNIHFVDDTNPDRFL